MKTAKYNSRRLVEGEQGTWLLCRAKRQTSCWQSWCNQTSFISKNRGWTAAFAFFICSSSLKPTWTRPMWRIFIYGRHLSEGTSCNPLPTRPRRNLCCSTLRNGRACWRQSPWNVYWPAWASTQCTVRATGSKTSCIATKWQKLCKSLRTRLSC